MKRICISINDWIYEKYIGKGITNRSKFIEEMFVRGVELELEPSETSKGKIVQLLKENRSFENQVIDLKKKVLDKDTKINTLELEIKKLKDKDNPENWKTKKIGGEGEWN